MEFPVDFGIKPSGKRKLRDEDVAYARRNVGTIGCRRLSNLFGVAYSTMWNAIKGLSFRHLNDEEPPQQ